MKQCAKIIILDIIVLRNIFWDIRKEQEVKNVNRITAITTHPYKHM